MQEVRAEDEATSFTLQSGMGEQQQPLNLREVFSHL